MSVPADCARRYAETGLWTDDRIGDLVATQASRHPDRELFCLDDARMTYQQFDHWVQRVAGHMVSSGVLPGDRVMVALPNCLEALVLQVAALRIGALDVPVIPIYREDETRQILRDARPSVVAVAARLGTRTPPIEMDSLLAEESIAPRVKFIVGGAAPEWSAVIERERVSVMMGATVFIQDLVARYSAGASPGHRLTRYMCAGATIPAALITAAGKVGVFATRNYGMTETAGICTGASVADPMPRRTHWDGRVLAGMEVEAVDVDRRPLPGGIEGELRIRGPQLFDGYTPSPGSPAHSSTTTDGSTQGTSGWPKTAGSG